MAQSANYRKTKLSKFKKQADALQSSSSLVMPSSWYAGLFDDQRPAADFLINQLMSHGGAGLLSEQGTGKTHIALAVKEKLAPTRTLIVCPLTAVYATWGKRIAGFCTDIKEFVEGTLIIGYEQFRSKASIKKLQKIKWDMAIFDEAQGLKQRNSRQSKAARRLRHLVRFKLILSGTPIDKSPIDMWAQLRFIRPELFGDVWDRPRTRKHGVNGPFFAEEFCRKTGFMGKVWEFIPEKINEFLRRCSHCLYRLESKLEKPKLIPVRVPLLGTQRRIYDAMERHGIVTVDGHRVKASLTVVRDTRCFQIVGGFLVDENGLAFKVGDAKQRKLRWLIQRLERPVVFCRYLPEVEEVAAILKAEFGRVGVLTGAVKDKKTDQKRSRLIQNFKDRKLDALVCQARTGGVSIEFQTAYELVMYSMGYSLIDFEQIIARLRRYGQEKRVEVYLITASDTVDEEPLDRVMEKREIVNPMMDYIVKESQMADEKKKLAVKKKTDDKSSKSATKKTATKTKSADKSVAPKYTVADVAKKLEITDATARIKLRNANIKKNGKGYGWESQAELDKVVKKLEAA